MTYVLLVRQRDRGAPLFVCLDYVSLEFYIPQPKTGCDIVLKKGSA